MGEHSLKTDLWNGLRGKCPACGKGHMFRAFLKVASVLELPADALAAPGVFEKVVELGSGWRAAQAEMPAPNRQQLLSIVAA